MHYIKTPNIRACFLLFFSLQLSLFCLMALLIISPLFTSLKNQLGLPFIVYLQWAKYLLAHLFLITLLTFVCTANINTLRIIFKLTNNQNFYLILIYWTLINLMLFLGNQIFYPLSHFARISEILLSHYLAYFLFIILIIAFISNTVFTIIGCCIKWPKISLLFPLFFLPFFGVWPEPKIENTSHSKPNIILIGFDSLKLNYVSKKNSPHLYHFLKQSIYFQNSITPLARTYPAWISILTGLYPINHGARFNLTAKQTLKNFQSLPWLLKKEGYQTVFATDERRFSNIDENLGFDKIIGPKTGINDFILGGFHDFPLSNLLSNSFLGKHLFPFNYINRASVKTYLPKTFNQEIARFPFKKPLFLAAHFTLTHWPYIQARPNQILKNKEINDLNDSLRLYPFALQEMDKQFKALLSTLRANKLLDNALVIVLSDHGETLYEKESRAINEKKYQGIKNKMAFKNCLYDLGQTELSVSKGHGSDILSPRQFQTLLAFKSYGPKIFKPKHIEQRVSLVDINPTIIELLNLPQSKTDGLSLIPLIVSARASLPERHFFMETGFSPNQNLFLNIPAMPDIISRIRNEYYAVNPKKGWLYLKKDKQNKLIKQKQYAVLYQHWLLALYPYQKNYLPVLLNLKTKQWTDNMQTPFATKAGARQLLNKLKDFYQLNT